MPSSIHQGDQFKETYKQELKYQNEMHTKAPMHERDFVPTNHYEEKLKSDYEHIEEKQF